MGTVDSVKAALEWAGRETLRQPLAAGIDTLLHWSIAQSGDREADRFLRPYVRSSVLSPNSLRGAMVVGGMSLAMRLRQKWPNIRLNETHPKALYQWLTGRGYDKRRKRAAAWIQKRYCVDVICTNEHELDALLSAIATREALKGGWRDLATAHDDHVYPIESITYMWPNCKAVTR